MPYHDPRDRDGSQAAYMTYRNYFYSAQTGEMLPTALLTQKDNQLPAGGDRHLGGPAVKRTGIAFA